MNNDDKSKVLLNEELYVPLRTIRNALKKANPYMKLSNSLSYFTELKLYFRKSTIYRKVLMEVNQMKKINSMYEKHFCKGIKSDMLICSECAKLDEAIEHQIILWEKSNMFDKNTDEGKARFLLHWIFKGKDSALNQPYEFRWIDNLEKGHCVDDGQIYLDKDEEGISFCLLLNAMEGYVQRVPSK